MLIFTLGLRLYGSAPSLLERVVPEQTTKDNVPQSGFDILGYTIPPGTIIATQAWSQHRDSSIFSSPEIFLPERWLDVDADRLTSMNQHMMPFGVGNRTCPGEFIVAIASAFLLTLHIQA